MKTLILTLLLSSIAHATSYTTVGNTTYASDGNRYTQVGNVTYGSDGSMATRVGNTTYTTPPMNTDISYHETSGFEPHHEQVPVFNPYADED